MTITVYFLHELVSVTKFSVNQDIKPDSTGPAGTSKFYQPIIIHWGIMKSLYHSNVRLVFIPLLMIIAFAFLCGITGSTFLAPAYEPVAIILLGLGYLGLARSRRKIPKL